MQRLRQEGLTRLRTSRVQAVNPQQKLNSSSVGVIRAGVRRAQAATGEVYPDDAKISLKFPCPGLPGAQVCAEAIQSNYDGLVHWSTDARVQARTGELYLVCGGALVALLQQGAKILTVV